MADSSCAPERSSCPVHGEWDSSGNFQVEDSMSCIFLALLPDVPPVPKTYASAEMAADAALTLQDETRGGMRIVFVSGSAEAAANLFPLAMKGMILTDRATIAELPARLKALTRLCARKPGLEIYELLWQETCDGPGTTIV
jgi:hypothetical protein